MVTEIWSATEFLIILDRFLPFYPPMDPENQSFEKIKKTTEDIIILQMCTIYIGKTQNFLSIWSNFYAFTPTKIQNDKKICLSRFISQEICIT